MNSGAGPQEKSIFEKYLGKYGDWACILRCMPRVHLTCSGKELRFESFECRVILQNRLAKVQSCFGEFLAFAHCTCLCCEAVSRQ